MSAEERQIRTAHEAAVRELGRRQGDLEAHLNLQDTVKRMKELRER